MAENLQVKPSDLAKAWSLARSSDLRQMTIRVPSETFVKIQALEAMFPQRTRNEMVADLLATALDEFVDGLPLVVHQGEYQGHVDDEGNPVYEEHYSGLRTRYFELVSRIRSESTEEKSRLEAVQTEQKAVTNEPKGEAA